MDLRLLSHQTVQTFFSAVRSGDLDGVRRVVEGPDARVEGTVAAMMAAQTENGDTALYIAAENNYEEIFRYLLRLCDFETAALRSRVDLNAFHVAAKQGHAGELLSCPSPTIKIKTRFCC